MKHILSLSPQQGLAHPLRGGEKGRGWVGMEGAGRNSSTNVVAGERKVEGKQGKKPHPKCYSQTRNPEPLQRIFQSAFDLTGERAKKKFLFISSRGLADCNGGEGTIRALYHQAGYARADLTNWHLQTRFIIPAHLVLVKPPPMPSLNKPPWDTRVTHSPDFQKLLIDFLQPGQKPGAASRISTCAWQVSLGDGKSFAFSPGNSMR